MIKAGIDDLLREQEGMTTINRETIQAMQLKKLNRLLLAEKERQGFYADAGLPEQLESLEQLQTLPFTTDEDLAAHAASIVMLSQSRIQRVLSDATSGTTGSAKRVFYSEQDCENTIRLFMAGLGELVFPGSRTMICMPFSGPHGLGELISEAIRRLGAQPLKVGCGLTYLELKKWMEEEQPDTFVGMPVPLISMLRVLGKGSLERALISADACPDSITAACEEILGSRLFPHYGSREMGLGGAITCQAHAGMHLRENNVIAEIIDAEGRPVPPGEQGELVITTIGMEAMPVIRYRTGDYTRILPGTCPCGSNVLRLDKVHRGTRQNVTSAGIQADGVSMEALDELLFTHPQVVDCSAACIGRRFSTADSETADTQAAAEVQKRLIRQIAIEVLITPGADPARTADCLAQDLKKHFPGTDFVVRCREVKLEDVPMYPGKRSILQRSN